MPRVIHFEIPADETSRAVKFYQKVFGWKIEKMPGGGPMEYWMIQTVPVDEKGMLLRSGVNGGMYKKERKENVPINYIAVESIDASIKQVKALGGKIVVDKQEVPGVGWVATALDPEGNPIAMLQPAQM